MVAPQQGQVSFMVTFAPFTASFRLPEVPLWSHLHPLLHVPEAPPQSAHTKPNELARIKCSTHEFN